MTRQRRRVVLAPLLLSAAVVVALVLYPMIGWSRDREEGLAAAREKLRQELDARGLSLGAAVFIRIFKQSRELEVWVRAAEHGPWERFRTYPICNYSGEFGPKLKEGDRQSPEGIYAVGRGQLHPTSRYHLAFNLGFPNHFDRANGRSGSFLMVHGNCVSIGCYAMTDAGIEEIYALADAALSNGQDRFWVHAFPARLTEEWLGAHASSHWHGFWNDLKVCYDLFESAGEVPAVELQDKRYRCRSSS